MRWQKLLERYCLIKRPVLRVENPRVGTSIIPLGYEDASIFFQYLKNKFHSIYFQGTEDQFSQMIDQLRAEKGIKVQKIKISKVKRKPKIVLLHLKLADDQELRRFIKLV